MSPQAPDLEGINAESKGGYRATDDKYDTSTPVRELSDSDEETYDQKNPFSNPAVAQRWKEQYEESKYECRHVFDPDLTWSDAEEKALIRKLDWRVCLWAVRNLSPALPYLGF